VKEVRNKAVGQGGMEGVLRNVYSWLVLGWRDIPGFVIRREWDGN
jgi:hypothetical protein